MKRICVFCGSQLGYDAAHRNSVRTLADELVARDMTLVYGGGRVGLMGVVADRVLEKGGHVIGVIPRFLSTRELLHTGVSEMITVDDMHQRKATMAELADGFIAAPGGLGTFEELFEVITWGQLGLHGKPIGLLNTARFYEPLLALIDHGVTAGYIREANRHLIVHDEECVPLLEKMSQYIAPPARKWLDADHT